MAGLLPLKNELLNLSAVILTHHILEVGVEVFDGTIYLHAQSIFDGHLE